MYKIVRRVMRRPLLCQGSCSHLPNVDGHFIVNLQLNQTSRSMTQARAQAKTHNQSESASDYKKSSKSSKSPSLDPEEIDKFRRMASSWWDTEGECKALHSMNKLRVQLISEGLQKYSLVEDKDKIKNQQQQNKKSYKEINGVPEPLKGLKVLDIGCGGGILTEPLARLGANVIGIDACEEGIKIAQDHLKNQMKIKDKIEYQYTTIEDFLIKNPDVQFDGIIASEIIEHVNDPEHFISTAASLLKNGGSFFLTTINRTTMSWLGAIIGAEYIFKILPINTHSWDKFLSPVEFERLSRDYNLETILIHGMCYNPFNNEWHWTSSTDINYAIHAIKTHKN